MSELEKLCEAKGVQVKAKYGAPDHPEFKNSHPWTVTLRYKRRQITTPFYRGSALTGEPSAADVLSCLCSDAYGVDSCRSFEEWAGDLGYDSDSRRAERLFKACEKIARKLEVFLGEEYETFCKAEH